MYRAFAVAVLAFAAPPVIAAGRTSSGSMAGTATCRVIDNACHVAWNFPAGAGTSYWIERFDPAKGWQRMQGPAINARGVSADAVEGGFLYRVIACRGEASGDSCESSTVQWAPIRPASVKEIPETVDAGDGTTMGVSKNLSYEAQRQQYNDYLIVVLLNHVKDVHALPPMTKPLEDPFAHPSSQEAMLAALRAHDPTADQLIDFVAYEEYEGRRREP